MLGAGVGESVKVGAGLDDGGIEGQPIGDRGAGLGSVKVEIQPPSITLRIYAHVIRAAEASAADVFAKAMGEQR
ncbi:hypothetical protein ACFYOK_18265 [Microbispora bryophytorum]|uniref:hypothetical protein n=1 Tax=Microbispora bryophytorum TaxID=1460882 RepID=UPI0033EE6283